MWPCVRPRVAVELSSPLGPVAQSIPPNILMVKSLHRQFALHLTRFVVWPPTDR